MAPHTPHLGQGIEPTAENVSLIVTHLRSMGQALTTEPWPAELRFRPPGRRPTRSCPARARQPAEPCVCPVVRAQVHRESPGPEGHGQKGLGTWVGPAWPSLMGSLQFILGGHPWGEVCAPLPTPRWVQT